MAITSLAERLRDPWFCPVDFDFQGNTIVFAATQPTSFPQSLRLNVRDFALETLRELPLDRVYDQIDWNSQRPSINYLFHLPFCGSSLLTRYLEDSTLMLRDPVSLKVLYVKTENHTKFPASISKFRKATLALLNRRPADRAIFLRTAGYYPQIIKYLSSSPTFRAAIFLYASPEYYFAQVLKSSERRKHARILFSQRKRYVEAKTGEKLETLTDASVVALCWIFGAEKFIELARQNPKGQLRTLESESFFSNTEKTIQRICSLFDIDKSRINVNIRDIESTHAKTGQAFSAEQRRCEVEHALAMHKLEIASGMNLLHKIDRQSSLLETMRNLSL